MSERHCLTCKYKDNSACKYPCIDCYFDRNYNNWQPAEPETCEWTYDMHGKLYYTECGEAFQFSSGELSDTEWFKFCPFCGREIKVNEEEDDKEL